MSLLPSRDDLLPGATKAASALLDALAEGSIVVVDRGRAEAAITEVLVTLTCSTGARTARLIVDAFELLSQSETASPHARSIFAVAAEAVRKAYEVTP